MKGVLIGSDFLRLAEQTKFLEINTDVDLFASDVEFLDLTPLFTYLTDNGYTKLVLIYKTQHITKQVVSLFESTALSSDVIVDKVVIPNNSITIPSMVSSPDTFYLRFAYDVTAIVDDTYCRDKSEVVKLLFNSGNQNILPKTYVVNPNDGETYDNFTNVTDNGIHPNVIAKKILPDFDKTSFPAFYKLEADTDLADLKQNLDNTTFLQQFEFNQNTLDSNRICDVIRTWTILLEDVETMIYIGGHLVTNQVPLDMGEITYENNLLDNKWRNMYFSNPNTIASGVPSTYSVIKIVDGVETIATMGSLVIGDVIKSVRLIGLDVNETEENKRLWYSSLPLSETLLYTEATVLNKKTINHAGWMIKIDYEINGIPGTASLAPNETILMIEEGIIKFKNILNIVPGDNMVLSIDDVATVTAITNEWLVDEVVVINIEPDDVFVAGTNLNEINVNSVGNIIVHNRKNWW